MKKINELFDVKEDFKIVSLHSDSRYVGKDSIFFCIEGLSTDGHKYADDAVFQGAKCIVHSKPFKREYPGVLYIKVNNVLDELNRVANIFYDYPSYKMTIIGVTGTSGKTLVSLMVKDVLNHYIKMGYIGTNDSQFGSSSIHTAFTTPETIFLHKTFARMVEEGVKGVSLEVSSYGLVLKRVDSVDFDIAVMTNIYEEHLDFHGTMENLMKAKLKLLELVSDKGYAVLNADQVRFMHFIEQNGKINAQKITYGIEHHADVMARNISVFFDHTEFDLYLPGGFFHVSVPILGRFNVPHVLAVISSLIALEMTTEQIIESIGYIIPIDGRMELIEDIDDFHVIVDYCSYLHNYEDAFLFAREVKGNGRIIAVFGPGSRDDQEKIRKLGLLADKYCDQVILTQQDADEDDIEENCIQLQQYITRPVSVILTNRRIAIRQAVELACKNDIILVLGKGHEQFMISSMGNIPYPGDKFVVKQAIKDVFKGGNVYEI